MNDAQRFLEALWGKEPPGLVQTWRLTDRRSWYSRSPVGAAAYCEEQPDVYTGVALAGQDHGRYRRARADQVVALAGLWLDIDVNGGPDQKQGAAPDIATALALAHTVCDPTLVVHSGHGVHAWHLFTEPWHFRDMGEQAAAAKASAQWFHLHRTEAQRAGWSIDPAHDLARLLRVPGTLNAKGGELVPVTTITDRGPRTERVGLLDLCAQVGDIDVPLTMGTGGALNMPQIDVGDGRAMATEILDALLHNSAEFKRTWMHARREQWSLSEYDLALCAIAGQSEQITDQQLADLIALHRRTWDPTDTKGARLDYVQRTVAKARSRAARGADVQWLKQAAKTGVAA